MYKKLFTLMFLGVFLLGPMTIQAQEDADEPMWETILLTPDNTKLKTLGENMRNHNQKYHSEGAHKATVYTITTGPNTGKMVWMMGPLKFSHLDSRPAEGGHDEDWRDNIMPYLKKISHGEYWQGDSKLSNTAMMTEGPGQYPIVFVRYWKVELGHGHNINHLLGMVSKTVKAMEGDNPWGVYYNLFRQGDMGRHIATVGFSKNWAEYDEDPIFKKTFLATHGDNSWDGFVRNMDLTFEDSWDEIWTYSKELSGD